MSALPANVTPAPSAIRRGVVAAAVCGSLLLVGSWSIIGVLPWPSAAFFYGIPAVSDESPEAAQKLLRVNDWNINEASGMALSTQYPGCIWLHNDSGDKPRLFLVAPGGLTTAVVTLTGIAATDWEDMCAFQFEGRTWLVVADTGDNAGNRGNGRPGCRLWIFPEPQIELPAEGAQPITHSLAPSVEVWFRWPGGPRDCESVAVDAASKLILLCTKAKSSDAALYQLPLDLQTKTQVRTAELLHKLPVPYATAMDLSPDGSRLAIINPLSGLLIEKSSNESWATAAAKPPTILTLPPRPQGETACFDSDGKSLLVGSEGRWQDIWKVKLPPHGQP
jgi:hypothetical protein